ncbi:HAD hydrolase-like protein [Dactylosporangium darangshiense]|uniref:HAD hydrolase-like protein n=1 Tax=Dactylosporangium darangshiense TaxID=579108 RepID=UPI0036433483
MRAPRDAGCGCRKPKPGLVLRLSKVHGIDLAASTMVGDAENDRLLAVAAGIGRFVWAADYMAD